MTLMRQLGQSLVTKGIGFNEGGYATWEDFQKFARKTTEMGADIKKATGAVACDPKGLKFLIIHLGNIPNPKGDQP